MHLNIYSYILYYNMSDSMYVLLGISNDTVEQETFVYFIGVFETLLLAKEKLNSLIRTKNTKRSDYIIKSVILNKAYDYDWSNNEEDEIIPLKN